MNCRWLVPEVCSGRARQGEWLRGSPDSLAIVVLERPLRHVASSARDEKVEGIPSASTRIRALAVPMYARLEEVSGAYPLSTSSNSRVGANGPELRFWKLLAPYRANYISR